MTTAFSKRHYEAIADAINATTAIDAYNFEHHRAIGYVMFRLADLFEADNPAFNRVRFFERCRTGVRLA